MAITVNVTAITVTVIVITKNVIAITVTVIGITVHVITNTVKLQAYPKAIYCKTSFAEGLLRQNDALQRGFCTHTVVPSNLPFQRSLRTDPE